jgi:NO-binding membrane sensor protein with MHYT domain
MSFSDEAIHRSISWRAVGGASAGLGVWASVFAAALSSRTSHKTTLGEDSGCIIVTSLEKKSPVI